MSAVVLKAAVIGAACTVAAIVVKRGSGELAILLSLTVCCAILSLTLGMASEAVEAMTSAAEAANLSPAIVAPVLKCIGIGVITRLSSDVCRDGGQSAVASAVETAGAVGAVCCAIPLARMLLKMLEGLL